MAATGAGVGLSGAGATIMSMAAPTNIEMMSAEIVLIVRDRAMS